MRRSVPLLVFATALVAAGCGGGSGGLSNQQYSQKLEQYLNPLDKTLKKAETNLKTATSRGQATSALGDADDATQTATQQISALDPPSAAVSSNSDLVGALGTYEKSIGQSEQIVRSGTSSQIKVQAKVFKSTTQTFESSLKQVQSQLASQGIKVSLNG